LHAATNLYQERGRLVKAGDRGDMNYGAVNGYGETSAVNIGENTMEGEH